jgi:hypothetical protein
MLDIHRSIKKCTMEHKVKHVASKRKQTVAVSKLASVMVKGGCPEALASMIAGHVEPRKDASRFEFFIAESVGSSSGIDLELKNDSECSTPKVLTLNGVPEGKTYWHSEVEKSTCSYQGANGGVTCESNESDGKSHESAFAFVCPLDKLRLSVERR